MYFIITCKYNIQLQSTFEFDDGCPYFPVWTKIIFAVIHFRTRPISNGSYMHLLVDTVFQGKLMQLLVEVSNVSSHVLTILLPYLLLL